MAILQVCVVGKWSQKMNLKKSSKRLWSQYFTGCMPLLLKVYKHWRSEGQLVFIDRIVSVMLMYYVVECCDVYREWQMERSFQAAMLLHDPEVVFVLGKYNIVTQTRTSILTRDVKTVIGKSVNRFPTGNRFSERTTGYWIYRTSCRHDPGNADGGVWPLPRRSGGICMQPVRLMEWACGCVPALRCCRPPFSRYSSIVATRRVIIVDK